MHANNTVWCAEWNTLENRCQGSPELLTESIVHYAIANLHSCLTTLDVPLFVNSGDSVNLNNESIYVNN